ncbi:PEP-CTERM sorting domain-containing protein [bacterium]|nr:PEP-CTERM sorting domain-containing protein [bacterium]
MNRHRLVCSIAVLTVLSIAPVADAGILFGPDGAGGFNAYELITATQNYGNAITASQIAFPGAGVVPPSGVIGHLASYSAADDLGFLATVRAPASQNAYIGLTDDPAFASNAFEDGNNSGGVLPANGVAAVATERGAGWAFVDTNALSLFHQEPAGTSVWGSGEPNDSGGEHVAELRNDGRLNDIPGGNTRPYIIEWDLNLASEPPIPDTPFLDVGPAGGWDLFGIREVINNGGIGSVTAAQNSLLSGNGTIFDGTGAVVNHNDPDNAGGGGYFGNGSKSPFLSDQPGDDSDISFIANGTILIDTAGYYTFGFYGDDGSQLKIDGATFDKRWSQDGDKAVAAGNIFTFEVPTGTSNSGAATWLDAGAHRLEFTFFELGGGAYVELWAAQGDFASFNSNDFHLIGDVANGGLQLVPEPATLTLLGLGLLAARRRRKR